MAARLREEGQHIKVLFKDLVGVVQEVDAASSRPVAPIDQSYFPGVSVQLVGRRPVSHL